MRNNNQETEMIKSQIISDISVCLSRIKIDEAMLMFIHIYEELGSVLDMTEDSNLMKRVTDTHNDFIKLLKDKEFRRTIEMFYTTKESDAKSLLFDKEVDDNGIYDLDMNIYGQINELFIQVYKITGAIKEKLVNISEKIDLCSGFNT